MAELYIQEIRRVQERGPYHLAGYSFGGFIALEMAQRLRADGEVVALLAMLDAPTPDLAQRTPSIWEYVSTHLINLWHEVPSRKLQYIASRMQWLTRKYKMKDRDYEEKLKRENPALRMYQVLTPNYKAAERYSARPYDGPITVFRASFQTSRCARFPFLGWDSYSSDVEAFEVPGDHYSIVLEPHVKELATLLNHCLNRVYVPKAAPGKP
jgi:thioesterase domain-containing protein